MLFTVDAALRHPRKSICLPVPFVLYYRHIEWNNNASTVNHRRVCGIYIYIYMYIAKILPHNSSVTLLKFGSHKNTLFQILNMDTNTNRGGGGGGGSEIFRIFLIFNNSRQ